MLFGNTFWLNQGMPFHFASIVFLLPCRAVYELCFDFKRSCWEFDRRSRSWPDRKRSCCIQGDPYCRPKHIYGVFVAPAGGHKKGSLAAIFRFRISYLPVFRCLRVFRMVSIQKRRLSFFSHWLIMKRSQNWPNLMSPISKLRDMHFIDTVTHINRPGAS